MGSDRPENAAKRTTDGVKKQTMIQPSSISIPTPGKFLLNWIKKLKQLEEPSFTVQPVRWPIECQVSDERIKHIYYNPSEPEPFYVPTGKEAQPPLIGKLETTIYECYPTSVYDSFKRSSIGGSPHLLPTCPNPEKDSLKFESRFESGNLAKAVRITGDYYKLYISTDLYTNRHMNWFYFRVTNMKTNIIYRFSIVNMTLDKSLYKEGLKPLLYSTKDAKLNKIGWRRCGDDITYYKNTNLELNDPYRSKSYTLTFTLKFPHNDDVVYLAYSYPYTYSDLQEYLLKLYKHPVKSKYTTLKLLCRTLAGNNLYYVTITARQDPNETKKKRAIIITARVHPSETPSSWMMKGFIDFLTSSSEAAQQLREKFIFKLVPMLNPDGVIVGNTRVSLAGKDLNREYRTALHNLHPSIWFTKLMIKSTHEECGVALYCDMHAHPAKHNMFVYGCENKNCLDKRLGEKLLPVMLHKNAQDKFSFRSCKFNIQSWKEGTGRIVMWRMGINNSYTMEASFGGSLLGKRAATHFAVKDYEHMGRKFCQTLLDLYEDDPKKVYQTLLTYYNNDSKISHNSLDFYENNDDVVEDLSDAEKNESAVVRALVIALCFSIAISMVLIYILVYLLI